MAIHQTNMEDTGLTSGHPPVNTARCTHIHSTLSGRATNAIQRFAGT